MLAGIQSLDTGLSTKPWKKLRRALDWTSSCQCCQPGRQTSWDVDCKIAESHKISFWMRCLRPKMPIVPVWDIYYRIYVRRWIVFRISCLKHGCMSWALMHLYKWEWEGVAGVQMKKNWLKRLHVVPFCTLWKDPSSQANFIGGIRLIDEFVDGVSRCRTQNM